MCHLCKPVETATAPKGPDADITRAQIDTWLDALESGEYQQVGGKLFDGDLDNPKHCCLGVYGRLNGGVLKSWNNNEGQGIDFPGGLVNSYIPSGMMVQAAQGFFSALNDSYGMNFKQIAHIGRSMPTEAFSTKSWWKDNPRFEQGVFSGIEAARLAGDEKD